MKTKYKKQDLRELYRVDNKYWKTGDTDLLDKRINLAKSIDEKFWCEVASMTAVATRKHLPVQTLVNALKVLGFEMEGKDDV